MYAEELENYEKFDPKYAKKCKIADFDQKLQNRKIIYF